MKIETKYNFGDTVFQIGYYQCQKWQSCAFCNGKGRIEGHDESTIICPKCYGRCGWKIDTEKKYTVGSTLTIGMVQIRITGEYVSDGSDNIFANYGSQKAKYEETYMCRETGIGSGSVWNVKKLFPTEAEAQAECDRLNKDEVAA